VAGGGGVTKTKSPEMRPEGDRRRGGSSKTFLCKDGKQGSSGEKRSHREGPEKTRARGGGREELFAVPMGGAG